MDPKGASKLLESAIKLTKAERGCIKLLNLPERKLVQVAEYKLDESLEGDEYSLLEGLIWEVTNKNKPFLTFNVERHPNFPEIMRPTMFPVPVLPFPLRCVLCTPLPGKKQNGALYLDAKIKNRTLFSEDDLQRVQVLLNV